MNKPAILCVDDEPIILDSLKRLLRKTLGRDYLIELAASGTEALDLITEFIEEKRKILLVVSDYIMPQMRGDELLEKVHKISPKTINIMLTGQADIEAIGNAINRANLYRYISKPWNNEDLSLTVKEAIHSYFQEQKLEEQNEKLQQMNQALEVSNREQSDLIAKLHENENRLAQFIEAMPVGVFVVNAEGQPDYINSRAQELLGQGIVAPKGAEQLRELYRLHLVGSDRLYPEDSDPILQALQGKRATADDIEIHQPDRKIPIETWGTPIYDTKKNIAYAIAAFQDITERKQAEIALKQAEQKYRSIFENALEGIFQTSPDGRYLSANPALAQIYGYDSPAELIAAITSIQEQLYVDPHRWTEFVQIMRDCGEVSGFESQVYRQDGSIIWISENARAVVDVEGNLHCYQGFIEDISDRKQAEEEREKFTSELFNLNQSFSRFVPRQFLQFLDKESIADVQIGDQAQQEMSVLFADIRNFTTLSETMDPADNFKFINAFLSRMEPAILKNQGFIDKYIGDAIMALFSDRADDAVQAGVDMLKLLIEYNSQRGARDRSPIQIGIGINTGDLMLGTVGGESRMDTTVISDAVNLAARLEGLTKYYGVPFLITHNTFLRLNNSHRYAMRLIDRVKVKGKLEMVSIFEVFEADPPELKEKKLATKSSFEQALLFYYLGSLSVAYDLLQECLQQNPDDSVVQIYIERCLSDEV